MKKTIIMSVMVAILLGFAGFAKAAEPNKPVRPQRPHFDPNAIVGKVEVTQDANGAVTSVKIKGRRNGDFNVVLDEKGKELAAMADKFVRVTGKKETKDGVQWLTVETIQEIKRARPADPNQIRRRPNAPGAQK
ncbi:MAG: hypothetical protein LLF92_10190 [Planctomycetaceae bacterium]|nr:hypothetical protein [Planctomycetaceae bacterium]